MDLATGPMGSLLLKLGEVAMDEYKLQNGVKRNVEDLRTELASMQSALRKVGDVPSEQLDEQVKLWAHDVRELSYDAEDIIDAFMVRVEQRHDDDDDRPATGCSKVLLEKVTAGCLKIKKGRTRHDIAGEIKDIMDRVREAAARRDRYKMDSLVVRSDNSLSHRAATVVDPRLSALYRSDAELVGVRKAKEELMDLLTVDDGSSNQHLKVISVVGLGGLGKTTLAKAVFNKLQVRFDCTAFVSVSRNPDLRKVLNDMLYELDKGKYRDIHSLIRDEKQLIDELREFLETKRYLIVIDDIWDIPSWRIIRNALVENYCGSRIITTTRDFDIAELVGVSYKQKILTPESSKVLFYRRIFGHEYKCPEQFAEISEMILKKCGGVPLAIITIASLLAVSSKRRNTTEWYKVYSSIGSGLGNSNDVKDMRMILSLSYYGLPPHIRTCLLHLSIFPEDYRIMKCRSIRMWIAEGIIQHEKDGDNLFEVGESCFNELINRSLIQPSIDDDGKLRYCRMHDMILDLVRSLSCEQNFVTLLGDIEQHTYSSKARRLSLHNSSKKSYLIANTNQKMSQVRSLTIFGISGINLVPSLLTFQVLRVLDLECYILGESCHFLLRHVWKLVHLRYLRLDSCGYDSELLDGIERLKFLQTLVLTRSTVRLPSTLVKLRQLMFLHVDSSTVLPDGIGNLTSLEELSSVDMNKSPTFAQELRNLTKLRELKIWSSEMDEALKEVFIESLCSLHKIQTLKVFSYDDSLDFMGERWMPSGNLRRFLVGEGTSRFSRLPACIKRKPCHLTNLSVLSINLEELQQEDLKALGRLPSLRSLSMFVNKSDQFLIIGDEEFHCLISFTLWSDMFRVKFQHGAMPMVQVLNLHFHVRYTKDGGNGNFSFGLENLLSLERVSVVLSRSNAREAEIEEAETALRRTIQSHPNHPTIQIKGVTNTPIVAARLV
uniref:AAA+ ATPase domain-containing protein n=1 Tax=Oryza nivara TaxID=4536 RepID=A0A0E0II77_ORYNI